MIDDADDVTVLLHCVLFQDHNGTTDEPLTFFMRRATWRSELMKHLEYAASHMCEGATVVLETTLEADEQHRHVVAHVRFPVDVGSSDDADAEVRTFYASSAVEDKTMSDIHRHLEAQYANLVPYDRIVLRDAHTNLVVHDATSLPGILALTTTHSSVFHTVYDKAVIGMWTLIDEDDVTDAMRDALRNGSEITRDDVPRIVSINTYYSVDGVAYHAPPRPRVHLEANITRTVLLRVRDGTEEEARITPRMTLLALKEASPFMRTKTVYRASGRQLAPDDTLWSFPVAPFATYWRLVQTFEPDQVPEDVVSEGALVDALDRSMGSHALSIRLDDDSLHALTDADLSVQTTDLVAVRGGVYQPRVTLVLDVGIQMGDVLRELTEEPSASMTLEDLAERLFDPIEATEDGAETLIGLFKDQPWTTLHDGTPVVWTRATQNARLAMLAGASLTIRSGKFAIEDAGPVEGRTDAPSDIDADSRNAAPPSEMTVTEAAKMARRYAKIASEREQDAAANIKWAMELATKGERYDILKELESLGERARRAAADSREAATRSEEYASGVAPSDPLPRAGEEESADVADPAHERDVAEGDANAPDTLPTAPSVGQEADDDDVVEAVQFLQQASNPTVSAPRGTTPPDDDDEEGWNIFTGGHNVHVLKTLGDENDGLFYVSVNLFLNEKAVEPTPLLLAVKDVAKLPQELNTTVKHLKAFNDHAWVQDVEKTGTLNGINIWALTLT